MFENVRNFSTYNMIVLIFGLVGLVSIMVSYYQAHKEFLERKERYEAILQSIRNGKFKNADGAVEIESLTKELEDFSELDRIKAVLFALKDCNVHPQIKVKDEQNKS